jgi:hypothetical protein
MIDLESNPLSEKIVGCAIAAHRQLGSGLLDYQAPNRLPTECSQAAHRGIVEHAGVLELKSIERTDPVFDMPNSSPTWA